ncbi:MAG TPA: amino acid permease [Kofleriaceae bacterium]|nr:amino acid permease [Kofleriaceae bacterium]
MDQPQLKRDLGPWPAASLVVGIIIGTGVFLKTAVMAREGGSAPWVLAAWVAAGVLSFTGALASAELGGRWPRAGGEYVFLREGYGPGYGFLYAWNRFWIGAPGSIAAYAVGTTTFFGSVVPLDGLTAKLVRIGLIALLTALNCARVVVGGWVQTVLTTLKVVMIVGLALGALAFARGGDLGRITVSHGWPGWSAFGAMLIAALWAYDGWNNLPSVAGELRDPERTLPRATVYGTLAVIAIYLLVNVAYFYALPFDAVAASSSVAQATAATFLGGGAQLVLALAMTLSTVSAMNGSILSNARIPFAASRDGLGPAVMARLSPVTNVPVPALLVQGVVASIYAFVGKFDELTDAVIVVSWMFYGANALTVIRLRKRRPPTAYRTPGYPIVPALFVAMAVLLIVNTIWAAPRTAVLGGVVTAVGALVYRGWFARRSAS